MVAGSGHGGKRLLFGGFGDKPLRTAVASAPLRSERSHVRIVPGASEKPPQIGGFLFVGLASKYALSPVVEAFWKRRRRERFQRKRIYVVAVARL
jgi:hypothetical protein